MRTRPAPRDRRGRRGYTLVEVLVALMVMAILATLAWQGLDGIVRARDGSGAALDRTTRLATVLTQWEQDLAALHDTGVVPPLAFDGQTLRLTRRVDGGVALVAWALHGASWQRWSGPPTTRSGELQQTWLRSQQLLGNEAAQVTLDGDAAGYQVYFFRGGAWTNAQSTGDLAPAAVPVQTAQPVAAGPPAAPASAASAPQAPAPVPVAPRRELLPEAVRLVIALGGRTLTRDIALGPGGS